MRIVCPIFALCVSLVAFSEEAMSQVIEEVAFGNAVEALAIRIDGEITAETPDLLREFIERENPEAYTVLLNSPGGNLFAGMEIGRIIREHEYVTEVGDVRIDPEFRLPTPTDGSCLSACALAFLGGIDRSLGSGSRLGFHQFYGDIPEASALDSVAAQRVGLSVGQVISGMVVAYAVEMGVDARIFTFASNALPEEMSYISGDEAIEMNVVTRGGFGPWFLEPYKEGLVVASRRTSRTTPYDLVTQTTIYCREPSEQPYLMMTVEDNSQDDYASLHGFEVSWQVLSKDGSEREYRTAEAETNNNDSTANVALPMTPEIEAAIVASNSFSVRLLVGRSDGGYVVVHVNTQLERKMIEATLKLCI